MRRHVVDGVQVRRHLWKTGWALGCDYPGKSSIIGRLFGLLIFPSSVCYWRWVYRGWMFNTPWSLAVLIWSTRHWRDWDAYAPRKESNP